VAGPGDPAPGDLLEVADPVPEGLPVDVQLGRGVAPRPDRPARPPGPVTLVR
jgi:hypothetical protein